MPNENTMGAPTEGLGQTVTFATNGGGGVPQAQGSRRQSIRLNASGGGARLTSQALQVPETQPDATFAVLAKLGGELLKPHLEAERTAAYFSGMQKAAAGQAITDIVEEQPWYSKVFGSTSVVDGARAYTASAKASQMAVDLHTKMPEIRKMSGPEFAKYSTDMVAAAATGDNVTDMMFQQQAAKTLPEVMKTQATEHYKYQRELYYGAQEASVNGARQELSIADSDLRKATGGTDEGAKYMAQFRYVTAMGKFVQSIQRDPQMDKQTHDKILSREMQRGLMDKDFSMYNAMKGSGLLDKMEPELAVAVQGTFERASSKARATISDDLIVRLTNLTDREVSQGKTEAELLKGYQEFNVKYTAETGDPSEFFGPAQTVQGVLQHRADQQRKLEALLREQERAIGAATTLRAKQDAIADQVNTATNALFDPSGNLSVAGITSERVQAGWAAGLAKNGPDRTAQALVMQAGKGEQFKYWKDALATGVTSALDPKVADPLALYEVYDKFYRPLVKADPTGRDTVAQLYANSTHGPMLRQYHAFVSSLALAPGEVPTEPQLYKALNAALIKPVLPAHGKLAESVEKHLDSTWTGWTSDAVNFVLTGDWVPIQNVKVARDLITPHMRDGTNAKSKSEVSSEVDRVLLDPTTNLEQVGGHVFQRRPGSDSVASWVASKQGEAAGVNPTMYHRKFNKGLSNFLAERGLTEPSLMHIGNIEGTPTFLLTARNGEAVQDRYVSIVDILKAQPKPLPNPGSSLSKVGEDGTGWQGVLGSDALKKTKTVKAVPTNGRTFSGKVSQ